MARVYLLPKPDRLQQYPLQEHLQFYSDAWDANLAWAGEFWDRLTDQEQIIFNNAIKKFDSICLSTGAGSHPVGRVIRAGGAHPLYFVAGRNAWGRGRLEVGKLLDKFKSRFAGEDIWDRRWYGPGTIPSDEDAMDMHEAPGGLTDPHDESSEYSSSECSMSGYAPGQETMDQGAGDETLLVVDSPGNPDEADAMDEDVADGTLLVADSPEAPDEPTTAQPPQVDDLVAKMRAARICAGTMDDMRDARAALRLILDLQEALGKRQEELDRRQEAMDKMQRQQAVFNEQQQQQERDNRTAVSTRTDTFGDEGSPDCMSKMWHNMDVFRDKISGVARCVEDHVGRTGNAFDNVLRRVATVESTLRLMILHGKLTAEGNAGELHFADFPAQRAS